MSTVSRRRTLLEPNTSTIVSMKIVTDITETDKHVRCWNPTPRLDRQIVMFSNTMSRIDEWLAANMALREECERKKGTTSPVTDF
jgi:hypothetical protein